MTEQKVAVVTGASRGIGKAIAMELARTGALVIVNYNGSREKAEEVKAQIEAEGNQAEIRQCNVADFKSCEDMFQEIISAHGRVDILVNNAGITRDGLLMKMSEEDFIETEITEVLSEKVKEAAKAQIPFGTFGQSEDIAKTAAFLASDDARYITGQVICVDGGM